MSALRATSMPLRSSRGSGSVYPSARAARTAAEKDISSCRQWQRVPSVPLKQPAMRCTSSPVSSSVRSVAMMGSPAPTVAS